MNPRLERWLSLALCLTVVGGVAAQLPEKQKPAVPSEVQLPVFLTAKPVKSGPKDDELQRLLKARYNAALADVKAYYEMMAAPVDRLYIPDDHYGRWQRFVQAGLELCDTPAEKVALLTQYAEMARAAERDMEARRAAGRVPLTDLPRAHYERLDAEVQLLRAKREAEKMKKEATSAPDKNHSKKKKADDNEMKLVKELLDVARKESDYRFQVFLAGRDALDQVLASTKRLLQAELQAAGNRQDRIAAWEAQRERTVQIEKIETARFEAGRTFNSDVQMARFYRIEAEIGLERAKKSR